MTRESSNSTSSGTWLLAGTGVASLGIAYRLVVDAFSPAGIAYTFGYGDGAGLLWPDGSTVLTWALLIEACALSGVVGNYATGRQKDSTIGNVAAGHVRFAVWLGVGLWALAVAMFGGMRWLITAAMRSWRGSSRQAPDPADDFAQFDMGDSGASQEIDHGGSPNLAAS